MRYKRPDRKNALSILQAANRDMQFTLSLQPSTEAGPTIIRNIYECFRMLGDSLLVSKGISSQDHIMPIQELIKLNVKTTRPLNLLDNLRKLRHNINYYGYSPTPPEVENALNLARTMFNQIEEEIKKNL